MEIVPIRIPRPLSIRIGGHLCSLLLEGPAADAALLLPAGNLCRVQELALLEIKQGEKAKTAPLCVKLNKLAISGPVKLDIHAGALTHLVLIDKPSLNAPIGQFPHLQHLFLGDIASFNPATQDITLPLLATLHIGMRGLTAHLVYLFFRHVSTPQLSSLSLDCDWLLMTLTFPTICQVGQTLSKLQTLRLLGPHFGACRIEQMAGATANIQALDIPERYLGKIQVVLERNLWPNLERIRHGFTESKVRVVDGNVNLDGRCPEIGDNGAGKGVAGRVAGWFDMD